MTQQREPLTEPTFDRDGYPTDETLERIATWPLVVGSDYEAAMDFAGRAWNYPEYWVKTPDWPDPDLFERLCLRYEFSTIGWSGNESIIGAIESNMMLRMMGAWSWRRGGHYEYRFGNSLIKGKE